MEGDEILTVNGCGCRDVSYERLIALVEHAGHYLDLDVIRLLAYIHISFRIYTFAAHLYIILWQQQSLITMFISICT